MENEYPRIGHPITTEKAPEVFELRLSDYFTPIIVTGLPYESIDPDDYFITSGDAIRKTEQLIKDINLLIKQLDNHNPVEVKVLKEKCIGVRDSAIKMKADLEIARAKFVFMETEWEFGVLIVIPKNPRIKPI